MPPIVRRLVAVTATVVVAALALAGCGGGEQRVALAVHEAERPGPDGIVVLHVECADDVEVELGPDPAGSPLPQVTVWGDPVVGRCDTVGRLAGQDLPGDAFVDGATSQVVKVSR